MLDGQQRLTSLYQAFYGVGEHRYYLNLRKLLDGGDFEEAIFHVRATTKWAQGARELRSAGQRADSARSSVLKGGAGGFLQWVLQVTNPMPAEERTRMLDALTKINEQWIKTIDDYHFPVVTLSDKTEPDALCTIFETLNRTGVKLSVFELLTARFWPQNIKLRALWDKALDDHPIIADFEVDPYYVLQAIALASRKAPSCKRSDVLNLAAADIDGVVGRRSCSGLPAGLEILRDDCKVMLPKWLPYQTMLPPLAAVLAKSGMPEDGGGRRPAREAQALVLVRGLRPGLRERAEQPVGQGCRPRSCRGSRAARLPESVRAFRFDPQGAARRDAAPAFDLPRHDLPDPRHGRRARLPHAGRHHRQADERGRHRRPPRLPGRLPAETKGVDAGAHA